MRDFDYHATQAAKWTGDLRTTLKKPWAVGVAFWQAVWGYSHMELAKEAAATTEQFNAACRIRGELEPLCRECARQIDDAAAECEGRRRMREGE